MNASDLTKLAIAGGILFAAFKWGNPLLKAASIAIAAGIVAKRVPYLQDVV